MAPTNAPSSAYRRLRDSPAVRSVVACALRCAFGAMEASVRAKSSDDK